MKRFKIFLLVFFAASFGARTALAQSNPAPGNFQGRPGFEKREELQTLLNQRLVDGLGLSQDQAQKLIEIMKKYHQKRRSLREQMRAYRQQLETVTNSSDSNQIQQLISNLQKTRNEMENLEDAQFKDIKPMLTPQQQAKYLIIMEQIRRDLMQIKKGNNPMRPSPTR